MPATTKHPFKLAKLVHHDHDLSKRWYVDYSAWDVSTGAIRRVRQFEPLNREKNLYRRLQVADNLVRIINGQLREGKCLGKDKVIPTYVQTDLRKRTVGECLGYYIEQKKLDHASPNYLHCYKRLAANWGRWLEDQRSGDILLKDLTTENIFSFFDFFQVKRKIANKTFNNYRNDFSTFINWVMRRHPNVIKKNPLEPVRMLKSVSRKHAAFSDDQMKAINKFCSKDSKYHQLLLFINFIYYAFIRPTELRQLKIENIDLVANRIFVPGTISKNRTDEYISIAPPLRKSLLALMRGDPAGSDYIFGRARKTGPLKPADCTFWRLNFKVLKALGLTDRRYDLYGYKHSGVISLYKTSKDVKLIQSQCRHKTLEQTNTYLRDLDLHSDHDRLKNWKGF